MAMHDFTFSDGTTVPQGSLVSVSAHTVHRNEKVYEDPLKFDGFRFSKMREETGKKVGMVSSSLDHFSFGHGRHTCPGRYFAACELKLMFAHIITTYDVKLEVDEGVRPPDMWIMTSCIPNPNVNVLFRKRANV
jgi:cytochrome P450